MFPIRRKYYEYYVHTRVGGQAGLLVGVGATKCGAATDQPKLPRSYWVLYRVPCLVRLLLHLQYFNLQQVPESVPQYIVASARQEGLPSPFQLPLAPLFHVQYPQPLLFAPDSLQ